MEGTAVDISNILDTYNTQSQASQEYEMAVREAWDIADQAGSEAFWSTLGTFGLIAVLLFAALMIWATVKTVRAKTGGNGYFPLAVLLFIVTTAVLALIGAVVACTVAETAERDAAVRHEPPAHYTTSSDRDGWEDAVKSIQKEIFLGYGVAVPEDTMEDAFRAEDDDIVLFTAGSTDTVEHYGVDIDEDAKTVTVYRNGKVLEPAN